MMFYLCSVVSPAIYNIYSHLQLNKYESVASTWLNKLIGKQAPTTDSSIEDLIILHFHSLAVDWQLVSFFSALR